MLGKNNFNCLYKYYTLLSKKHILTVFLLKKNIEIIRILRGNHHFVRPIKRVYHHHLMKTGGTSLNKMFIELSGTDVTIGYNELMRTRDLRIIKNKFVYTAWNQLAILSGNWHYSWSHRPIYKMKLPKNTFIITSIRHPYERVFSRYKHLLKNKSANLSTTHSATEYKWLGNGFDDYLKNIPDSELCHQLAMYSKNLNVKDALKQLERIDFVIDLSSFSEDIEKLNDKLNIKLKSIHTRKNSIINIDDLDRIFEPIKHRIAPELLFYNKILELKSFINV